LGAENMAKYYPMLLNIENKQCIVVGGGNIAYRKCLELIEYEGEVTVISNSVNEKLEDLINKKVINYICDYYKKSYIEGAFIVIAATDDNIVNYQISQDCNEKGVLVNVVDVLVNCNFIVPAKIRRGDLTIAISTNGKSPALSKGIKQELEKNYDENYGILVDILGDLREEVIKNVKSLTVRKNIFKKMATEEYLQNIKALGKEATKEEMRKLIYNHSS
jgi:precorrin-2 dehydrogenase / sirohydrochlorin ferrochelatase